MSYTKENRQYLAIDLKSFYASVECVERGLDPLTTNLVVADEARTRKTICLAVSPSLKSYGIPGRPRLYEVYQKIAQINRERQRLAPDKKLNGKSVSAIEIKDNPTLAVDFFVAKPQMAKYMAESTRIYKIYSQYISPEDIHVYSVDEVFMDVTHYLKNYNMTSYELAKTIIQDILNQTHITATAGIGTNLFLSKVAMDIVAKHSPANEDGVRIAELDEMSYRQKLWAHQPLTDFWRIGQGYARKLAENNLLTMGDVARCSINHEDLLYRLFGVNAELLIDHAWGWEPCTIADIKAYQPETSSLSTGQVLPTPYQFNMARLIVKEMTDLLILDMVDKEVVTDQIVMAIGYDAENLSDPIIKAKYNGPIKTDYYGRAVPRSARGTINLPIATSSATQIKASVLELYDRIIDKNLLVRRINITANHIINEKIAKEQIENTPVQLDIFTDYKQKSKFEMAENAELEREKRQQQAILEIKRKFGKNAILRGMNLEKGATTRIRNNQIGGHHA